MKKVTVYCASSDKLAPEYFDLAEQVGKILAQEKITVLFGGGSKGLMGKLADSVLKENGTIIGIMPEFMKKVEWDHPRVSELIVVKDMHERKKGFMQDVDALITLPGGCGTLEELLEAITLKRLGVFIKPIIIINLNGFYDPLIEMLNRCVKERFMREEHLGIWTVINHPEELLEAIRNAPAWDHAAIDIAAV